MTRNGRSSRWAAALALGLAGLISGSAATVHAAPAARTAANPFELTFEATPTTPPEYWAVEGTFRSRAPFCASGTFFLSYETGVRFTCDDGAGSLTVGFGRKRWTIGDGAGSYAGFRGKGSLQVETPIPWRGSLLGVVDRDAVAPTIAFTRATATKLRRPAGAYTLQLGIALRDDVADNPVTYTVRACAYYVGCAEVARRFGTDLTGAVSLTLRIRPPAGVRVVQLRLTGEDPVGNVVSLSRDVKLPR